jgi:hypothetical protein
MYARKRPLPLCVYSVPKTIHPPSEAVCVTGAMTRHAMEDFHHGGVLCTFSNREQPQTGTSGVFRQGRRHGPSITFKITPSSVTLHQPARRPAVLGQPSSLCPHCIDPLVRKYNDDLSCTPLCFDLLIIGLQTQRTVFLRLATSELIDFVFWFCLEQ